tara:strand:+ start:65 stop:331 length:267 start_codon:yes stop_codon:yes gene_type:complete
LSAIYDLAPCIDCTEVLYLTPPVILLRRSVGVAHAAVEIVKLALYLLACHANTSTKIRNTNGVAKIEAQAISSPMIVRVCLMLPPHQM